MKSLAISKYFIFVGLFVTLSFSNRALAIGVYQNFDNFPPTGINEKPSDETNGTWTYHSGRTDPWPYIQYNGWRDEAEIAPGIYQYITYTINSYNSLHMGFETYGFMEIDDQKAVKGNSLKITTTGGINDETTLKRLGIRVENKEEYIEMANNGIDPVYHGGKVGHPYIYFMANNSSLNNLVTFPVAQGANKLSMYILMPSGVKNGTLESARYDRSPQQTINLGPYANIPNPTLYPPTHPLYDKNGTIGGHWYNVFYNEGGGWTHILAEPHPQHNNAFDNAAKYPYPSYSMRDLGLDFYKSLYRNYITFYPYVGIDSPPYYTYIDEIEFIFDEEPQNNETINNPGVTYYPEDKHFSIGWNDKYKNNGGAWATYEIRYSFSQITNANWSNAKLVTIIDDPRYNEVSSTGPGRIKKHWPYSPAVFGQFTIDPDDKAKLTPKTTIYFAIKDVSQNPIDTLDPISDRAGRDYRNNGDQFDYAGDAPDLPLIKRIDFYIPETINSMPQLQPTIQSVQIH